MHVPVTVLHKPMQYSVLIPQTLGESVLVLCVCSWLCCDELLILLLSKYIQDTGPQQQVKKAFKVLRYDIMAPLISEISTSVFVCLSSQPTTSVSNLLSYHRCSIRLLRLPLISSHHG